MAAAFAGSASELSGYKGMPYQDNKYAGGVQKIPGRVMCAYYDRGGEGVAYHDSDAKNSGSGGLNPADGTYLNEFRMHEGVDTSYTKYHNQIDDNPFEKVHPPGGPNRGSGSTSRSMRRVRECTRAICCIHRIAAGRSPST
jgi:hypothetical protein